MTAQTTFAKRHLHLLLLAGLAASASIAAKESSPAKAPMSAATAGKTAAAQKPAKGFYSFQAQDISGRPVDFASLKDKVVLVVNTASQCGFTPQFTGLEVLHKKYKDKGLVLLAFPSNEFGGQDPKPNAEIERFARQQYGVSFPMMAKIQVNGANAHPLYQWLQHQKAGVLGTEAIKWNFTKFLINRNGQVVGRYGSSTEPEALAKDIEAVL